MSKNKVNFFFKRLKQDFSFQFYNLNSLNKIYWLNDITFNFFNLFSYSKIKLFQIRFFFFFKFFSIFLMFNYLIFFKFLYNSSFYNFFFFNSFNNEFNSVLLNCPRNVSRFLFFNNIFFNISLKSFKRFVFFNDFNVFLDFFLLKKNLVSQFNSENINSTRTYAIRKNYFFSISSKYFNKNFFDIFNFFLMSLYNKSGLIFFFFFKYCLFFILSFFFYIFFIIHKIFVNLFNSLLLNFHFKINNEK